MEKIQPGKYVEMGYDLYEVSPEGDILVHQTDVNDPEKIIYGVTRGMIVPLEKAIEGLEPGGEFDVKVSAEEGFGPYDLEQIAELDKDIFKVEDKFDDEIVKVGNYVPMMTADGFRINGKVLEVTPTHVKMDFNHPLAGKEIRFKGKILTVRDATPEELKPATCGCGCGCDSEGCDSGSCGGGCNA
ncbi:MAG: FKBP-type peptidyl-prolyl cis-trans isomerase [Muribaculaceae bacterium]|nr:FKBP-type peptidyl-prolyl cis-trans isomerase [Muribaculaceae bacterium]